ncbi:hypothetical protein Hanom_Chr02g00141541 [Helianthus anomalus]
MSGKTTHLRPFSFSVPNPKCNEIPLLRYPFLFHYKLTLEIFQATQHSSPSISNRINGNFYPQVTLHGELKQVSNRNPKLEPGELSSRYASLLILGALCFVWNLLFVS